MTHVPTERLREILAGCDGVTPGPWRYHVPDPGYCTDYVLSEAAEVKPDAEYRFRNLIAETDIQHSPGDPQRFTQNAKHIAACDPETIRSLVSELLELREAASEWAASRAAVLIEPVADVRKSETFRLALNRLGNAEDALARTLSTPGDTP